MSIVKECIEKEWTWEYEELSANPMPEIVEKRATSDDVTIRDAAIITKTKDTVRIKNISDVEIHVCAKWRTLGKRRYPPLMMADTTGVCFFDNAYRRANNNDTPVGAGVTHTLNGVLISPGNTAVFKRTPMKIWLQKVGLLKDQGRIQYVFSGLLKRFGEQVPLEDTLTPITI